MHAEDGRVRGQSSTTVDYELGQGKASGQDTKLLSALSTGNATVPGRGGTNWEKSVHEGAETSYAAGDHGRETQRWQSASWDVAGLW